MVGNAEMEETGPSVVQSEHFGVQDSIPKESTKGLIGKRYRLIHLFREDKPIYSCLDTITNKQCVLKFFPNSTETTEEFKQEVANFQRLNPAGCSKVLQMLAFQQDVVSEQIKFSKGSSKYYSFIVLPLAKNLDLLNLYIKLGSNVTNRMKHFYFAQTVYCILELHTVHGMAHRDVKPENFVLLDDLSLNLIDLGFSCPLDATCYDRKGTPLYYPNEILEEKPEYSAHKMDIFQLGVTLFIIMFGRMPWDRSDYSCPNYTALVGHETCLRDFQAYYSVNPDVDRVQGQQWWQIILACLDCNPTKRPTVVQIRNTEWVQSAPQSLDRRTISLFSRVCQQQ